MKLFKNVYIINIFYPPFYSEGSLLFCVFLPVLVFVQDEKNLPRCVLTVMSVKVLDYFFVLIKSMLYSYLLNILD